MLVLARSPEGKEFLYSSSSAHSVPKASANKIRDTLNRIRYKLKDGEVWHLHEVGQYDLAYEYGQCQSFRIRTGHIYESIR